MPEMTATVDVCVVCSGAPKRGMGWYHCKQLFDNRVKGARLTDVVEPWFLGKGKGSNADFEEWQKTAQGIAFHEKISEVPIPAGAPKLAIICCRTMDAPRIFREAVDHGFTHVYLEKPGAPTVADLEEMTKYASSKGVPVFMGFNRNFSKYVRLAQEFYSTAPASASLTIGRNDMFNSPEAMDECFERNAEGMMKNMMIHELVVLISYFGLSLDAVDTIVEDKAYTTIETRKGFTDFSKVGFTMKLKSGKEIKVWGDRAGGEYGEAIVTDGGKELFKAIRPDEDNKASAAKLEEACPGCMPYFYLQDGEYLLLKQTFVDHILQKKEGAPAGCPTITTAIEGLGLCEFLTGKLMDGKEPPAKKQKV
jgi:predicted dehydrogenase